MDFLSIRRKARERAEAEARRQAGAAASPHPPEPGPIEQALRQEGTRPPPPAPPFLTLGPPAPPALAPPPASPQPAPAAARSPEDPLRDFFWREDEEAPGVPDLGGAAPETAAGAERRQARQEYVAFHLGAEEYGLAIDRVREIVKPPPIAEVPRAPAHLVGVVTLRGEVVPVFDPRRRLWLPPQPPGPRARILVCESARGPAGLLVDAVSHVLRLAPSAVEPRPAGLGAGGSEAIAGIGREGERMVILLDLDLLLGIAPPPVEGEAG